MGVNNFRANRRRKTNQEESNFPLMFVDRPHRFPITRPWAFMRSSCSDAPAVGEVPFMT